MRAQPAVGYVEVAKGVYVDDEQARSERGCALTILFVGIFVALGGLVVGVRNERFWVLLAVMAFLSVSPMVRRVPSRLVHNRGPIAPEAVVVTRFIAWRRIWDLSRVPPWVFVEAAGGRHDHLTPMKRWAIDPAMVGRTATAYHLGSRRTVLVFDDHSVLWCWRNV